MLIFGLWIAILGTALGCILCVAKVIQNQQQVKHGLLALFFGMATLVEYGALTVNQANEVRREFKRNLKRGNRIQNEEYSRYQEKIAKCAPDCDYMKLAREMQNRIIERQ